MHHFDYRDGILHAEDVPLPDIAASLGTPTYIYSSATLERHYTVFRDSLGLRDPHVFYAVKANGNLGVLMTLARLGAEADTVSEGEIRKALAAGIPAGKIVFSGVGKTESELAFAVEAGIYQVNVESEGELDLLSKVAAARGKRQPIVLRVNPEVGAGGHAKITTGGAANKFGVSFSEAERLYARAANMPGVSVQGLAVHIGSQILKLDALEAAFRKLRGIIETLRAQGHGVTRLDLGGGLGIPYEMQAPYAHGPELLEAYGAMVRGVTEGLDVELGFEPGRLIAGNAGILMAQVLYVNESGNRRRVLRRLPMMWSARSANRATPSPPTGSCPRWRPATCWSSRPPGPTVRRCHRTTTSACWFRKFWCAGPSLPPRARARPMSNCSGRIRRRPGSRGPEGPLRWIALLITRLRQHGCRFRTGQIHLPC
jgi:diaminopimelate decarboxylase